MAAKKNKKSGPTSEWCPICQRSYRTKTARRHARTHIRPEIAQERLRKNAVPLRRAGGARFAPSRSRSVSRGRTPDPGHLDIDDLMNIDPAVDDLSNSGHSGTWRAGPPPEDAQSSSHRGAARVRHHGVAVGEAGEEYEGEDDTETMAEAEQASAAERQDEHNYMKDRQYADDFDDDFWAEIREELLHSAEYGRT